MKSISAPRADAKRNHVRVLKAARELFTTGGVDVSVDDIARRAGVGVGTVYRHYPTKEKLVRAVISERLQSLTTAAESLARSPYPEHALFSFLRVAAGDAAPKRDLTAAFAAHGHDLGAEIEEKTFELHVAIARLLSRAQGAHAVRSDVSADALIAIISGLMSAVPGRSDEIVEAMVRVVSDGLSVIPSSAPTAQLG